MNNGKFHNERAGLYVHIPFCEAKCPYCGFYSEPVKNHDSARLVSAIITELQGYNSSKIQTIYIGGGSPSCLPENQLMRLVGQIISDWPGAYEFTIEANPGQVNTQTLGRLRKAGVTRISIGAQSFNAGELDFLGRRHSAGDIERAVMSAKHAGFDNVGLDLIFAIPGSTLKSWKHSLQSAIELDIQHISAYSLTYEKATPLQKQVAAGQVKPINELTDRSMYETAIDQLKKAGFRQYEISNFAWAGFECKHNLNYWANQPYIGVGPSAGSYWRGKRTLNVADINKYIEAIEKKSNPTSENETPDKIQVACETAVLNLRRRCGIDLADFRLRTGFDAVELFAEPIDRYKKLGLIEMTKERVFLTREALPIADSVLCDFSDI